MQNGTSVWKCPLKLNRMSYDPEISHLGVDPQTNKNLYFCKNPYVNACSSFIQNHQNWKHKCLSFGGWINKLYDGLSLQWNATGQQKEMNIQQHGKISDE